MNKRKELSREELLTRYAYRIAASGTTGDEGDIEFIMRDDGIDGTREDAEFVSNAISDIYGKLRKRGRGWKALVTKEREVNSWVPLPSKPDKED